MRRPSAGPEGSGSKMLARIVKHLRAQWAGVLALFLVLTGGVAYAANTVFSSDIVPTTRSKASTSATTRSLAEG